jgi:Zn-dependent metalloprotease
MPMCATLFVLVCVLAVSGGRAERSAREIALQHVREHRAEQGLSLEDLADVIVTSESVSEASGVRHVYLRQRHRGIEISGADMTVNITRDGLVMSAVGEFVANAAGAVNRTRPALSARRAARLAATRVGVDPDSRPREAPHLVFHRASPESLRLAWVVEFEQIDPPHWWVIAVDAASGDVLDVTDRVVEGARK